MTFLRQKKFDFTAGKHHFTPIYEQSKYKYLVYVDGHCAACRYGFMMRLGSVILKVQPRQVADTMWYFPLLKPYVDHIPIKPDLSDLEEKIRWCRNHDDKCREIAQNAKQMWDKYLSRKPLLDYVQIVCKQIAKRFIQLPSWFQLPAIDDLPPPILRKPESLCYEDKQTSKSRYCVGCQKLADEEAIKIQKEEEQKKLEVKDTGKRKMKYRNRMLKKAKLK